MEDVGTAATALISTLALLGVAAFFSLWVHRAKGNRALTMGLYIVFGAFGFFLFLFGVGSSYRDVLEGNDVEDTSILAIVVGVIVGIGMIPPLRRLAAKIIPFDPDSWPDTIGFILLSVIAAVSFTGLLIASGEEATVSYFSLILTALTEVALAFIAVGIWFYRTPKQSLRRLGLVVPSARQVGIALGLVIVAFIVAALSSLLVQELQPALGEEIAENLENITAGVDSIWGAVILGISAGVGEEILFRGAIQPRFGIVFTALVFALLHQQYGVSFVTLGVFAVGIVFGLERKYLNTTAAIITHAVYNTLAVVLGQYAETAESSAAQLLPHVAQLLMGS